MDRGRALRSLATLRRLHGAYGGLLLLAAGGALLAPGLPRLQAPFAWWLLGITWAVLGGLSLALARSLRQRAWGTRLLGLVLGLVNLPHVPLGTLLGLYTFWLLTRREVEDALGAPHFDTPGGGRVRG
jgi:hypothetical protein